MKILSSFDTNFKQEIVDRAKKKYGDNNFKEVSHCNIFYYLFVILPIFFAVLGSILYLIILFVLGGSISGKFKTIYYIIGFIIFLLIFIPLISKILKKYIDYILDFFVVTPNNIIYYNQEGILNRKGRTIDNEKIKTITVEKKGLLRSIFNFGNIVILTEGTEGKEEGEGEINISFIYEPDKVKRAIFDIINSEGQKMKE